LFTDAVTSYADDRRLSVEHDGFAESTQMKRDFEDVNEFKDLPRTECARKRCIELTCIVADEHWGMRRRHGAGGTTPRREKAQRQLQLLSAARVERALVANKT